MLTESFDLMDSSWARR